MRKATPQHHRPTPGGEAPAAELGAGAAGVRKATPQHHRPPPGGEAPAAEFAAAATGVRTATPRHQQFPPGGEAPAAKFVAAVTGMRKATPRHHRSPPGGPISVASTATVPAATAAAATTVGTFPPSRGDLRGTWRLLASSPHYRAATRGLSRGAWPWVRGRPVGVRHEGHGGRDAHGGEGRGGRTSSRLPAGRATGEGT